MTVVSELWQSSEMGVRILEKVSDPDLGNSETRGTSLEPSEPDPALFEVAADYASEDRWDARAGHGARNQMSGGCRLRMRSRRIGGGR